MSTGIIERTQGEKRCAADPRVVLLVERCRGEAAYPLRERRKRVLVSIRVIVPLMAGMIDLSEFCTDLTRSWCDRSVGDLLRSIVSMRASDSPSESTSSEDALAVEEPAEECRSARSKLEEPTNRHEAQRMNALDGPGVGTPRDD